MRTPRLMKILFLTNDQRASNVGGGSQRTKMLIKAIELALPADSTLNTLRIPFDDFAEENDVDRHIVSLGNDIEFALRLQLAAKRKSEKAKKLLLKIEQSDVVIVDNCYLYPIIKSLPSKSIRTKIIYLSQNYETDLKLEVSRLVKWPERIRKRYTDFVKELESYAWKRSDFRIVCAQSDGEMLNANSSAKFQVIPNGGFLRNPPTWSKEQTLSFLGCTDFVLYVASGHPPNVYGFLDGLSPDLGFMPSGSRLVIAGSSGVAITEIISKSKYWETFLNKGSVLTLPTDRELDNLYSYTSAVLMPIFSGSGTSIKAIEGVMSRKQIIATDFALRGIHITDFEKTTIIFAHSSTEFKQAIIRVLSTDKVEENLRVERYDLSWDSITTQAASLFTKIFSDMVRDLA